VCHGNSVLGDIATDNVI